MKAPLFPPHPDVGSLFMYWDRGGAHSQIAPLCPEAMAMAQLSGIYTACVVRYALAGLNQCVQRRVGAQSETVRPVDRCSTTFYGKSTNYIW